MEPQIGSFQKARCATARLAFLHWLVASRGGTMEMVSLAEVDLRMDGARMIRGNIAIMAKRRAG